MDDWGYIVASYAVAGGTIAVYALSLARRILRTSEELEGESERSWT